MRTSPTVLLMVATAAALWWPNGTRGDILITDQNNGRVLHYSDAGDFLGEFCQVGAPVDITVDAQNRVYVGDYSTMSILRFDAHGQFLDTFASPQYPFRSLAFHPNGDLFSRQGGYFADLVRIDPTGQVSVVANNIKGWGNIAIDASGILYVTDEKLFSTDRQDGVYRYTVDGTSLGAFGQATRSGSGLRLPNSIAFDNDGNLYAAFLDKVARYDSSGTFLGLLPVPGTAPYGSSESLIVDPFGNLYGIESSERWVDKHDGQGNYLGHFAGAGLDGLPDDFRPWGVAYLAAVPEPSTWALAACGLVGLILFCPRRRFVRARSGC